MRRNKRSFKKSTIISSKEAAMRLFLKYDAKINVHPTKDIFIATMEENKGMSSNHQFIYFVKTVYTVLCPYVSETPVENISLISILSEN